MQYSLIKSAIKKELVAGQDNIRASFNRHLLETHWRVGRLIQDPLFSAEDFPPAQHALILRLSRDFKRPKNISIRTRQVYA